MRIAIWALLILCAGATGLSAAPASSNGPEEVRVFEPKDLGYKSCRIPGIALTTKGTLLAWCEARHGKGGDWDPIDVLLRRSTDGGRTWGEVQHIAGDGKHTFNNPVALVDRDGGAIHILYCVDYDRCFAMRSDDDGRTFSSPVDVTATFDAFTKDYAWNVLATGPCHGIQLRSGRLLIPVWLSTGGHSHHPSVVATIYSDDRGKTWHRGDIAVQNTPEVPNPNETVAVELADGRVMLNSRDESPRHRRVFVTGPDGATGWSAAAFDDALTEPICNAAIVRVTTAPPADRNRIAFANPDNDAPPPGAKPRSKNGVQSYERKNLTLRLSYDEGKTWPVKKLLAPGRTDYCDLAADPNGQTIYCLHSVSNGLTLARVPLNWLTESSPATPGQAAAVELVRKGKPTASIIVPAHSLPVESYAAKELQYHIEVATGAKLPVIPEGEATPAGGHVYLGRCTAAQSAKLDPSRVPGNGYQIKTVAEDLYIAGNDSPGDPLDLDTHEGTLFAVYDLLEREAHVRWLWPGKLGEVIPHTADLSLAPPDATVTPRLWFKQWRGGTSEGERVWLKRQRFGRSVQPSYGHSFGKYWPRFGATHPEFFAMLPDGTRRPDPHGEPGPDWMHMCVSEPGLWKQIIADWKAHGSREFLNVCEDDGWAGCACPRCLAWDEPDPDNPVPFDQRLAAARKVFDRGRDDWMLQFGSLSDRYARFWKIIADEAAKTRPDVKVVSYVYDNYRKPPVKAMLSPNVLCGLVPQESIFGYSREDSAVFRHDWSGWERTGCAMFLRPNYTLQAQNFPASWAHTLGEDLKFAAAHGLRGTDFDSLTGKYATQGPTFYTLATVLNHPDASVDAVLDEFYSAFGPARDSVKAYFDLWESIYPQYSAEEKQARIKAKRKDGAGMYGPFYLLAGDIYTPAVMAKGHALLDQARSASAGDAAAAARVEWLAKGLAHADLMLATEAAYERGIDTGDKTAFHEAYRALLALRQANADYDRTHFAGLTGNERVWERADGVQN